MKVPQGKFAWTVKIGEKGQFVIPKEAREMFGFQPGETIILLGDAKRGLAIPPRDTIQKYAKFIFGQVIDDEEDDEEIEENNDDNTDDR